MKLIINISETDYNTYKHFGDKGSYTERIIANGVPYKQDERPKGKWIEGDVRNCHATLKCSVCDRVIEPTFAFGEYSYEDIKTFYPYCHCGAQMGR